MTQFKDVAHLYLGCNGIAITEPRGIEKLIGINEKTLVTNIDEIIPEDFKPILRPLSDMTKEEKKSISDISKMHKEQPYTLPSFEVGKRWAAFQTAYLLSRHFDLFGLIESGEAIDATTLTNNPYLK